MTCAIVIVSYNSGAILSKAVAAALASPAEEVVIVDNASTDGCLDSLVPSKRLSIVRNRVNLGYAAACNIGFRACRARHVAFLNPDARLAPGSLERLSDVLDSDPRIGVVGPLLRGADGREQRGGRRDLPDLRTGFAQALPSGLRRFLSLDDYNRHRDRLPAAPMDVGAVSGSCLMVRRSAAEMVGPWDEAYFLHVEDLDYCRRFHEAGWRVVFVPRATVWHLKGASSRANPAAIEWHKHLGMMRYYDKYLGRGRTRLVSVAVKLGILARFTLVAAAAWSRNRFAIARTVPLWADDIEPPQIRRGSDDAPSNASALDAKSFAAVSLNEGETP